MWHGLLDFTPPPWPIIPSRYVDIYIIFLSSRTLWLTWRKSPLTTCSFHPCAQVISDDCLPCRCNTRYHQIDGHAAEYNCKAGINCVVKSKTSTALLNPPWNWLKTQPQHHPPPRPLPWLWPQSQPQPWPWNSPWTWPWTWTRPQTFPRPPNPCCFLLLMKFMIIMRHEVPLVYFESTICFHTIFGVSNSKYSIHATYTNQFIFPIFLTITSQSF